MKLQPGEYGGNFSSEKFINGLMITKSYHLQHHEIALHHHTNPYYSFVLEGKYFEYYNKQAIPLKKGDIVFHPSDAEHSNTFESLFTTCLNIEFDNDWLRRFEIDSTYLHRSPLINNFHHKGLIYRLNRELENGDQFSDMVILGLATELTRSITKNKKLDAAFPYLAKVKSYIDSYPSHSYSLRELSGIGKVSEEHLCRAFKNKFGLTLGDYIRQKKIMAACELLKKKSRSIEEIALELGFYDSSHFNRIFKKVVGTTPKIYRSSL